MLHLRATATIPAAAPRRRRPVRAPAALGLGLALVVAAAGSPAVAQSRIKDIVDIEGVRDNQLVGYGLVVGLNGTGDDLTNSPFTEQSLMGMLERLGVNTRADTLRTKNVAAVMVTATLPAFTGQGSRIDVAIGTLGDSKSLLGGVLLVTPLLGADGEVYAVAQGSVTVSGFQAQGQATTVTQNVPTAGRIAGGAIVERTVEFSLSELPILRMSLRNPDFTTAQRVAQAINGHLGGTTARAADPSSIVTIPDARRGDVVGLVTELEQLRVQPDQPARVVIDAQSGVIVMGENVRISTVAIAQGNLAIQITETPQVSQPNAFSNTGRTVVVPRTSVNVDQGNNKRLAIVSSGVSLHELVSNLNALGVGRRDMITILQSIKVAGALQAEIEVL
jgi:flagellar P-ring protein precursor FlgI